MSCEIEGCDITEPHVHQEPIHYLAAAPLASTDPTPPAGPDISRDDNWRCECGEFHHAELERLRTETAELRQDRDRLDHWRRRAIDLRNALHDIFDGPLRGEPTEFEIARDALKADDEACDELLRIVVDAARAAPPQEDAK